MEDLAVFIALNNSGSFGKNFVKFKKNKYVIHRLRVGPYGEKLLPSAYGLGQYFQDLDHSFSPYGPPSRQMEAGAPPPSKGKSHGNEVAIPNWRESALRDENK